MGQFECSLLCGSSDLRGPVLYLSPFKLQIQVENHAIGGFGRSVPNTL